MRPRKGKVEKRVSARFLCQDRARASLTPRKASARRLAMVGTLNVLPPNALSKILNPFAIPVPLGGNGTGCSCPAQLAGRAVQPVLVKKGLATNPFFKSLKKFTYLWNLPNRYYSIIRYSTNDLKKGSLSQARAARGKCVGGTPRKELWGIRTPR